jgi:sterol desaturase/sphingolipid hydroxylase (fatty acid hydroxylase superfamily)
MGKAYTLWATVDTITVLLVAYCTADIAWGVWTYGWKEFCEMCLQCPLMGAPAGEPARLKDLPLFTYEVGHIIPGMAIGLILDLLFYVTFQEYKYADRDDARGIWVSFLAITGSAPILAPLHKQIVEGRMGSLYFHIEEYPYYWIPISLLASFFITETWFYWFHRIGHSNDFAWKYIHQVHHTFVPSTATCASAFHPLDIVGLTIGAFLVATFIPIYHSAHNGLLLINLFWGTYQHCAWRSRLPFPFRFVFNDSMSHTIHHDMGKSLCNLGSLSCIWDRLMGTYRENPPKWAVLSASAQKK